MEYMKTENGPILKVRPSKMLKILKKIIEDKTCPWYKGLRFLELIHTNGQHLIKNSESFIYPL